MIKPTKNRGKSRNLPPLRFYTYRRVWSTGENPMFRTPHWNENYVQQLALSVYKGETLIQSN